MQGWLSAFAYRVEVSPFTYLWTGVAFGLMIWVIVGVQVLLKARRRPAEVMREG